MRRERGVAVAADGEEEGALGRHRRRRRTVLHRGQERARGGGIGPALEGERALPHRRQELLRRERMRRRLGDAETLEAGGREDERVNGALAPAAEPRVDVAAERRHGQVRPAREELRAAADADRKSTRLNSSHLVISYAVFCLKKKKTNKKPAMSPMATRSLT